jgi:uncharacterized protein with ParB-like and HNH nuclease domain
MQKILGNAKTVRELLKGAKYTIDYYQREYKWESKQIHELIQDLAGKFLGDYREGDPRGEVEKYGHYFLGSIIISCKGNTSYIVDGQQRLTSLTLLLIFLRNLQQTRTEQVNVDELIFSEKYGKKSFNLDVAERKSCMEALFDRKVFNEADQPESVQNILARYKDIEEYFPEELIKDALPYFIDWLLENVLLVEITAYSDDEAYTIFETMNDRGLSLSPTDMLKGFLLANITDAQRKNEVNALWKKQIQEFNNLGKDYDSDFFKAWLRSQYVMKIRERKKGAKAEDFDRVGTEFHRWVRDNIQAIGLKESSDFSDFVTRNFHYYSHQYIRLMRASNEILPGFEHVFYNSNYRFTLQYMVLLAPLKIDDPEEEVRLKIRIVAMFLNTLLTWRLWNFRTIDYSTMQYAMFLIMRDIRGLEPKSLAILLREKLDKEQETFITNNRFQIHRQNGCHLHSILARITDYLEQQSGSPSHYSDYVSNTGRNRFEVEHIWANKYERHTDEFAQSADFLEYRNRVGGLLLLPKSFNASYGDLPYEEKLPHYNSQNLLARSLHPQCYDHNPGFISFCRESGLPVKSHDHFNKADLDERYELYRMLANRIWNPDDLLHEAGL